MLRGPLTAPHFCVSLGSALGASTAGVVVISLDGLLSLLLEKPFLNAQWSSRSPVHPSSRAPTVCPHVLSFLGPLLFPILEPSYEHHVMPLSCCLAPCPITPVPCMPMPAPCVPEGNVYLLGAAGHQALLQPEGLLLGTRLGVVVPHQAPLDLEMTR